MGLSIAMIHKTSNAKMKIPDGGKRKALQSNDATSVESEDKPKEKESGCNLPHENSTVVPVTEIRGLWNKLSRMNFGMVVMVDFRRKFL